MSTTANFPRSRRQLRRKVVRILLVLCFLALTAWSRASSGSNLETSAVLTAPSWVEYRIGDGIKRFTDAPGCSKFPDSLVCAYHRKTNEAGDISALIEVMNSPHFLTYPRPEEDIVVMHVRLGDGLCAQIDPQCRGAERSVPNCWYDARDCWMDKNLKRQYAFSRTWYEENEKTLERASTIQIVYDSEHWTRTLPDPRNGTRTVEKAYLENLSSFLEKQGHRASLRGHHDPDHDFVYMCHAQTFFRGGGGLSDLISRVVEARGGRVLGNTLCEACA